MPWVKFTRFSRPQLQAPSTSHPISLRVIALLCRNSIVLVQESRGEVAMGT